MIFVTVGTDQPFDRLVKVVDRWAQDSGRTDVFAQIGHGGWKPHHIDYAEFLDPTEFQKRFAAATIVIGHAGMGTILSSLLQGKPILVMPKRASLGEHRNEHQLATARRFETMRGVQVAYDENGLVDRLNTLQSASAPPRIGPHANGTLITALRGYITG